MNPTITRTCSACKIEKPLLAFSPKQTHCRECKNEKARTKLRTNEEYRRARIALRVQQRRDKKLAARVAL